MSDTPLVIFTLADDPQFDTADIWSILHRQEGGFDLAIIDLSGEKTKLLPAMGKMAVKTLATDNWAAAVNAMAAEMPHGIFVFASDRACPTHDHWIRRICEPLAAGRAEASFGREINAPGGNYFIIEDMRKKFPRDAYADATLFSMDNSAVKRETLARLPLPETKAHDPAAAWRARHGVPAAYCPEALALRQTLLPLGEIYRQSKMKGENSAVGGNPVSLSATLCRIAGDTLRDFEFALSLKKPQYLWYPLFYRMALHFGYYAGGKKK